MCVCVCVYIKIQMLIIMSKVFILISKYKNETEYNTFYPSYTLLFFFFSLTQFLKIIIELEINFELVDIHLDNIILRDSFFL